MSLATPTRGTHLDPGDVTVIDGPTDLHNDVNTGTGADALLTVAECDTLVSFAATRDHPRIIVVCDEWLAEDKFGSGETPAFYADTTEATGVSSSGNRWVLWDGARRPTTDGQSVTDGQSWKLVNMVENGSNSIDTPGRLFTPLGWSSVYVLS
jgi:hypothetical protein